MLRSIPITIWSLVDDGYAQLVSYEYGSVQQHLQPRHIQEMIVPVPDNWKSAQGMINAGRKFIAAMEKMS